MRQLFAKKPLKTLLEELHGENRLRRVLGPVQLTSLGIGAIIGAGIFVTTGAIAKQTTGPALMLSYVCAGTVCIFAALCYAEFASMVPVAGSAYTYAYATLGELLAWIIGWDLILEYALSAATVSSAWSEYLNKFLEVSLGKDWTVPWYLSSDPFSHPGALFNLPAVVILAVVTTILVIGIRESAFSNTVMVVLKLGVVLFVIAVGVWYINPANYTEIPYTERKQLQDIRLEAVHPGRRQGARRLRARGRACRRNPACRVTAMPTGKPHLEFHAVDLDGEGWQTPPGYPPGIEQKLLAGELDEASMTGSRTRLLRFRAGAFTTRPFVHDYWEEVFLVSGDLVVGDAAAGKTETFGPNSYASRPPGISHGPFRSNEGCLLVEFHYYE